MTIIRLQGKRFKVENELAAALRDLAWQKGIDFYEDDDFLWIRKQRATTLTAIFRNMLHYLITGKMTTTESMLLRTPAAPQKLLKKRVGKKLLKRRKNAVRI